MEINDNLMDTKVEGTSEAPEAPKKRGRKSNTASVTTDDKLATTEEAAKSESTTIVQKMETKTESKVEADVKPQPIPTIVHTKKAEEPVVTVASKFEKSDSKSTKKPIPTKITTNKIKTPENTAITLEKPIPVYASPYANSKILHYVNGIVHRTGEPINNFVPINFGVRGIGLVSGYIKAGK